MRTPLWLLLLLVGCRSAQPEPHAAKTQALDGGQAPTLSATRQLRRLHLTLRGSEPTPAQYRAALAAADAGTFQSFYDAEITAALGSTDFYEQMLAFGHEYLRVGDYKRGSLEGGMSAPFKGSHAISLTPCAAGTTHAGKLGHFDSDTRHGDPASVCNQAATPTASVEPWWAPGSSVSVIGRARLAVQSAGGVDCGRGYMAEVDVHFADETSCGCGPNLLYCYPETMVGDAMYATPKQSNPYYADSFRRLLSDEPARLFAHIATTNAPMTDLVLGDYTVAPRWLQFLYVRWGRTNTDNMSMDSSGWFRAADDNWSKVTFHSLHPNLLAARTYLFDPRTNSGAPAGIPSAGVLTQLGPNSWYPRERVRAARFLEIFACQSFAAPDPNMVFTPPYSNDPQSQGPCQHCHRVIEPAAIHFKRLEIEDSFAKYGQGHANLGGIGVWQWRRTSQPSFADANSPGGQYWYQPYGRWNVAFIENTFLTPVAMGAIATNPDVRFLDFLPAGKTLLEQPSDGTIGPLGFAKMIVAAGAFDRCVVDRTFQWVMGYGLSNDPNREAALVQRFVGANRQLKPFIESLVKEDDFGRGR